MSFELQELSQKRDDAIYQAKLNCKKLRNFMKYGIESFSDRLPSSSSSIIKRPEGFATEISSKYLNIITDEEKDKYFIEKMIVLIANLKDPLRDLFIKVYIEGKSMSSIHRKDKYKIAERGYLKLALLDADIDYTFSDDVKYNNLHDAHVMKTDRIMKEIKARLKTVKSLYISKHINLYLDEHGYIVVENLKMTDENSSIKFSYIHTLISWINELNALTSTVGLPPKDAIYKFIMEDDWKYIDTSDRNNLVKGMLALAYLDDDFDYSYEDIEYDAMRKCRSKKFVAELQEFQFQLKL